MLVYKFVEEKDGRFFSPSSPVRGIFEYRFNELIEAKKTNVAWGIYCFYKEAIKDVSRFTKRDFTLIELEVNEEDLLRVESERICVFKGVTPIRVIPREIYDTW